MTTQEDPPQPTTAPAGPVVGGAGPAEGRHWHVPAGVAVGLAVLGGVCSAGQSTVNGGLSERVGSPIVAGLVSNGIGTLLLVLGALTLPPVRAGLRRLH